VRFYTLPPIPYPYILFNANNPKISIPFKFKEKVESIILDSGIEIFRDSAVKDYPSNHIWKIVHLYNKLKRLFPRAEIWATIPDYCDDYHPQNLWLDKEHTNIERTVENIKKWTKKLDYVNWLIPIQGWNKQPKSIERSIALLEKYGITEEFDYFALGNLCVEPDVKIVFETARLARKLLPDKKLHIFGLKLRAVPLIQSYVDSFDNMVWTRPVNSSVKKRFGSWSCKTAEERKAYFKAWLDRLNHYLAQTTLAVK